MKKTAILFGPGVGKESNYHLFLRGLLKGEVPVVIDADGIWHLKQNSGLLESHEAPLILTPHFGELTALLGITAEELSADIIGIGQRFARKYHLILVLKGHRTLIFGENGEVFINSTGNPGMATAGSGDVLAGMIAGIAAQGIEPLEAAKAGVYYHGLAGDTYAGRFNETTLTATDLIDFLKVVINH